MALSGTFFESYVITVDNFHTAPNLVSIETVNLGLSIGSKIIGDVCACSEKRSIKVGCATLSIFQDFYGRIQVDRKFYHFRILCEHDR